MHQKFDIEIKGQNENTVRFRLKNGEKFLTFKDVFELWTNNPKFVKFYKDQLIKLDYEAFYWEHPAIKKEFLEKKYECILQRSRPLEHLPINESAFKDFIHKNELVTDFLNMGKNAILVVPTKKIDKEIYNHMGKFIRLAEQEQIIEVFKRVGKSILEEIENQKLIWLNTAGLGVVWLHIRMDTRPKYYKTTRYKEPDFLSNIK
ncbi:MAG: hypothetical protein MK226_24080 [Saprospiraceae bacterium]|nr:hypothetical protein [Saprospiraceae bacterium]